MANKSWKDKFKKGDKEVKGNPSKEDMQKAAIKGRMNKEKS